MIDGVYEHRFFRYNTRGNNNKQLTSNNCSFAITNLLAVARKAKLYKEGLRQEPIDFAKLENFQLFEES